MPTTPNQKPASNQTVQLNHGVYALLDFDDTTEWDFATRGLIDAPEALVITDEDSREVWSQKAFAFLGDASDTAAR